MSIEIIDLLKPKNNGSFPIVDAPDVKVGNQRLDAAINLINTALSGKASQSEVDNIKETTGNPEQIWNAADSVRTPIVSFVSDDGAPEDISVMAPIFKAANVPATCALISTITSNPTRVAEYIDLQDNYGWEIASHSTDSTLLSGLTDLEIITKLTESRNALENAGFKINAFVYPSGSANARVRRLTKRFYRSGYNYNDRVNKSSFLESWSISRVPLGAFYADPSHNTLEYYKSCVDEAFANNGWCIFCLHPYKEDFDSTQQEYLAELIEYIKQKEMPIVTLSDGYKLHGNIVEAGESFSASTEDQFQRVVISNDGRTNLPIYYAPSAESLSTKVPSDFRNRCVTLAYMSRYTDGNFPDGASGLVCTVRASDICTQLWLPNNSNRIYKRQAQNDSAFGNFTLITEIVSRVGDNTYSASQAPTALPAQQITISEITNGLSLGWPTRDGTLIIKRFPNYVSEMFLPADSDTDIYRRHWDATNSTWTPFANIGGQSTGSYSKIRTVNTNWNSLGFAFTQWLYIDLFESMEGVTCTISQKKWALADISDDSSVPTEIGSYTNGLKLYMYRTASDTYIKYSSTGNNYPAAITILYK